LAILLGQLVGFLIVVGRGNAGPLWLGMGFVTVYSVIGFVGALVPTVFRRLNAKKPR
jgi:hypothetical protein